MGHALRELNRTAGETIILTATSGDTGSAVANGFYGIEGVKVVILYPDGQVSGLQESQMTTLGGNIFPLKVKGTFDDCQRIVKDIFSDADFRREKRVTSANSINILRWIPQSFYYFHGWAQWVKATGGKRPGIVVPSGNYGNLAAGLLAAKMGLPVRRFIAAANANDTVPKYLRSGRFEPQPSVRTVANAMDVGNPSNFERIVDLFGNDFSAVTARIRGYSCDDQTILEAIRELYDRTVPWDIRPPASSESKVSGSRRPTEPNSAKSSAQRWGKSFRYRPDCTNCLERKSFSPGSARRPPRWKISSVRSDRKNRQGYPAQRRVPGEPK